MHWERRYLNLGCRWRWAVNFRPWPLCLRRNNLSKFTEYEAAWIPEPTCTFWTRDVYFLFWESNQEYSNVQPAYTIQVFCIITLINNNTSKHCDYVFFRPTCFGHRIFFEGVFDMLRSVKWKALVPCVQFDLETGFETEVCRAGRTANETVWYVLDGLYFNWNQYV